MIDGTIDTMETKLGQVYANIAGDGRYGQWLEVLYCNVGDIATLVVKENGAVGGMDGPGGSYPPSTITKIVVNKPTGASLCKAIKQLIKSKDCDTIARYGKPTKKFTWTTWGDLPNRGLNMTNATNALNFAKEVR